MKPCVLPLVAVFTVACDHSRPGGLVDPPIPVIVMNGRWAVTGLVRLGGTQALPMAPGTESPPFRPLHEGMEIEILDGQLRDRDGGLLFGQWNGVPNQRYFNVADGIALQFDWASSGGAPCVWHEEVTLHGMAHDEDRIVGSVTIVSSGDCQAPGAPLPAEATGAFQFMLERVVQPAAQVATSDR